MQVDTGGVCAGDGSSCRKSYVKLSLSTPTGDDAPDLNTDTGFESYKESIALQLGLCPAGSAITNKVCSPS